MRTLALIPARAGSKGIPRKNTRPFAGRYTLVDRAFVTACMTCDRVRVSTNDPQVAVTHVENLLSRPAELATDDTPMLDVVKHAAAACADIQWDVLVLLQPTQPLRKPEHIRKALALLEETGADSVVSVVQIPAHYSPEYVMSIDGGRTEPWLKRWHELECSRGVTLPTRRQDCEPAYSRDGTVYAIKRETIEKGSLYGDHCVPLVIPANESCNLDTEEDWQRAEAMVRGK